MTLEAQTEKDTYYRRFDCKKYQGVETQKGSEIFRRCKIKPWCNNKRYEASCQRMEPTLEPTTSKIRNL